MDSKTLPGLKLILWQLAAFLMAWSTVLDASEIYKWVGEDGVVHFSDSKPKENVSVSIIRVEERNPDTYDPTTDPYSILNQAKRVNESWLERLGATLEEERQFERARNIRHYAYPLYIARRYAPLTYYPASEFYPVLPTVREPLHRSGAARRQINALNALALTGRRPGSINSGVHHERVQRSRALPGIKPGAGSSNVIAR